MNVSLLTLPFFFLPESPGPEDNCVDSMVQQFYLPGMLIAVVDTDFHISVPAIYQNTHGNEMVIFEYHEPEMYIISARNGNLTQTLDFLKNVDMFNSRAKYIILSEANEEIFQQLSKHFIYNVAIINSNNSLITYNPYMYEDVTACGVQPTIFDECNTLEFNNIKIFKPYFPKFWRNTTLKSVYVEHFPYIYYKDEEVIGENYKVLQLVKERIKFKLNVTKMSAEVNLLDLLQTGEKHMVINHKTPPIDQHLHFDLVPTNLAAHFLWVVPQPKQVHIPHWKIFLQKFDVAIWLGIFFFILLSAIIWYQIEGKPFTYSLLLHYQMFLESSNFTIVRRKKLSTRILTGSSLVFFLVLSATFKSEMLQSFTTYIPHHPVNSINDIIKKNMTCYVSEDLQRLYKNLNGSYARYITQCNLLDDDDDQQNLLMKMAVEHNFVTVSRVLKYKLALNKLLTLGLPTAIHMIQPQVKFDFLYIHFTKGYPMYQRFQQVIEWMHSAGLTSFFRQNIDYQINRELKSKENIVSKNLTLEHISIAFYIILAGLGCSTLVFLLELVVNKV